MVLHVVHTVVGWAAVKALLCSAFEEAVEKVVHKYAVEFETVLAMAIQTIGAPTFTSPVTFYVK